MVCFLFLIFVCHSTCAIQNRCAPKSYPLKSSEAAAVPTTWDTMLEQEPPEMGPLDRSEKLDQCATGEITKKSWRVKHGE